MKVTTRCTRPQCVCANEKIKLIGGIDGYFPDFGHHLENEMGGLWLYPVKLLDGFWMHFTDHDAERVSCYMKADEFVNHPHKNEFYYFGGLGHTYISAKRTQIAPDGVKGIIVRFTFENNGKEKSHCSTEFIARVNLCPIWLSEELGIYDGDKDEISYLKEEGCFLAKDSNNSWYAAIGCVPSFDGMKMGNYFGSENTKGNGTSCVMEHHFTLEAGEKKEITFHIAGSDYSKEDAISQLQKLKVKKDYEKEKKDRLGDLLCQSRLSIADQRFETIYDWVKVNTDWLILDHEKYGRGLMAGLPEYPWWFGCDNCYSLQGVLVMGDFSLCKDTLKLILDYSEKVNGNGRIVHEILPNGFCPNHGNTQETAHFIIMVWKYYEWTGDSAFLQYCIPYIKKGAAWLLQKEDGDLFPGGYGIMEITGLDMQMIDTAVYTCEAYGNYSKMMYLLGEKEEGDRYTGHHLLRKEKINEIFWDEEEGLYCDAYTSFQTISQKEEMILEQLKYAKPGKIKDNVLRRMEERKSDGSLKRGWLLNHNWVINTPMEMGIAPREKAKRALEKMNTPDYAGAYGIYLDALKQSAIMTISTGVIATAQGMYGNSNEALELIERMFSSFSMATPGSISEMSPDYGCFTQAWTAYGVFWPIVRFFFGIQPMASEGRIILAPCMPDKWEQVSLENVKVLDGTLSIWFERKEKHAKIKVQNNTSYPITAELVESYDIKGMEDMVIQYIISER